MGLSIVKKIIELNITSIFFISGRRLKKFLELVHISSKNIEVAICKELTKINESVFRGNIKNIIDKIKESDKMGTEKSACFRLRKIT